MSFITLQLVEHPHSNIFLLKTNLLQLIIDVIKYLPHASTSLCFLLLFSCMPFCFFSFGLSAVIPQLSLL